jgi:hypothetical protein
MAKGKCGRYTGMLFTFKTKDILSCNNMNEPGRCYGK